MALLNFNLRDTDPTVMICQLPPVLLESQSFSMCIIEMSS